MERQRLPVWGIVLIALLALNVLLVVFLLLRNPATNAYEPVDDRVPSPSPSVPTTLESSTTAVPQAAPPSSMVTPAVPESVTVSESTDLDTRDDLLARGASLPTADLNMHVYDANPALRFVLLNGQRLREGESSKEGLLLERITPEGVVVRYGSNTFAVNLQ